MRSFLLVLPLLVFPGVVSLPPGVKNCGGPNDHLKNPAIKLKGNPVKGGTLTIEVTGTLDKAEGDFISNVDLRLELLSKAITVKGGLPMTISPGAVAGPFAATIGPISLPTKIPGSFAVTGQVHMVNAKKEPIMCLDLDINVPGAGNDEAPAPAAVETPPLTAVTSCSKPTDHLHKFKMVHSGGVINMTGTLDEATTKAAIDLDVMMRVLWISAPFKMGIAVQASNGLLEKGPAKITIGPSTIVVSPNIKTTMKGTMKISDGSGQEITCLNVDTVVAATDGMTNKQFVV